MKSPRSLAFFWLFQRCIFAGAVQRRVEPARQQHGRSVEAQASAERGCGARGARIRLQKR